MKASRRGMTLMELMVAAAITTLVTAMALSVVTSGVRIARQGEQTVSSNAAARTGMEMLLRDLRLAGVPGGIWVASAGGIPVLVNPVFTQAGATGADDLWIVVPRANAMQANCTSPGSGAVVTANGTGALKVNCTNIFQPTDTLLVSNYTTAALIDGLTFPSGTSITYSQQAVPNFSSAPAKGGFQRGDMVVPVEIVRYSVRLNAMTQRPELIRHRGSINTNVTAAAPFAVPVGAAEERFPDVEDLQVAFGTGVEPNLAFASGHHPTYVVGAAPLAVRISVVGITERIIYNDLGQPLPLGPVTVEDHVAPATTDGYRRSVYRRRVELLNMATVNL